MSTQAERAALMDYLDSPWGTTEERAALDHLTELMLGGTPSRTPGNTGSPGPSPSETPSGSPEPSNPSGAPDAPSPDPETSSGPTPAGSTPSLYRIARRGR